MTWVLRGVCLVLALGAASGVLTRGQSPAPTVTWVLDNLANVGGHPVTVVGTPAVVDTPVGRAVEFNGTTDGLFIDTNPLAGLAQFTMEVLVEPAAGGNEEQRFLHIAQADADHRALIELRSSADGTWCLDTFLRFAPPGLTLIDRTVRHPSGTWHTVALTYDGTTMASWVDGQRELGGTVAFGPMGEGRTSLGVRQNKVSWFKGRIRLVRISAESLPQDRLLRPREVSIVK